MPQKDSSAKPESTKPDAIQIVPVATLTYRQFLDQIRVGVAQRADELLTAHMDNEGSFEGADINDLFEDINDVERSSFEQQSILWNIFCRKAFFSLTPKIQDVLVLSVADEGEKLWLASRPTA